MTEVRVGRLEIGPSTQNNNEELIDQIDELTDRVEELERLLLKFVDHYNANMTVIGTLFKYLDDDATLYFDLKDLTQLSIEE